MTKGFVCGAWDLLHPGHLWIFEEAKTVCDHLIVGLHADPSLERFPEKKPPVQSLFERYEQLRACRWVDEIVPYETEKDLLMILQQYPIDVRFLGEDYVNKDYTGDELFTIRIHYIKRRHDLSSTDLRNRLIKRTNLV